MRAVDILTLPATPHLLTYRNRSLQTRSREGPAPDSTRNCGHNFTCQEGDFALEMSRIECKYSLVVM